MLSQNTMVVSHLGCMPVPVLRLYWCLVTTIAVVVAVAAGIFSWRRRWTEPKRSLFVSWRATLASMKLCRNQRRERAAGSQLLLLLKSACQPPRACVATGNSLLKPVWRVNFARNWLSGVLEGPLGKTEQDDMQDVHWLVRCSPHNSKDLHLLKNNAISYALFNANIYMEICSSI